MDVPAKYFTPSIKQLTILSSSYGPSRSLYATASVLVRGQGVGSSCSAAWRSRFCACSCSSRHRPWCGAGVAGLGRLPRMSVQYLSAQRASS